MFDPDEPLLLGGGDDLPVRNQGGGGIAVVSVEAKDDHFFPSFPEQSWSRNSLTRTLTPDSEDAEGCVAPRCLASRTTSRKHAISYTA